MNSLVGLTEALGKRAYGVQQEPAHALAGIEDEGGEAVQGGDVPAEVFRPQLEDQEFVRVGMLEGVGKVASLEDELVAAEAEGQVVLLEAGL